MKISSLNELDLSQYKLAYYKGNSLGDYNFPQDTVMKLAEVGKYEDKYDDMSLTIALIPKEKSLTDCDGDDWDDTPAATNATGFDTYPKGTIFLKGRLGGELILCDQ